MRLLIIDDDAVDRRAVARALRESGMEATLDEAATPDEGLQRLGEHEYDCVLVDYMLPGTDGLQVLRTLRATGILAPIVILTGQGDEEVAVSLMKAGAADYVSKQALSADRLARSLRYAVAMARAEYARRQALAREKAAREEAQAANRAKDEFLATLSHELRTPLNAILGWARLLAGGTLDLPTTARAIEIIERNSRLQAQLIEDLLDISRIVTGNLRLELQPSRVSEVVAGAVDAARPAADAKHIAIEVDAWRDERPVWCDPARVEQIVWNLLSNAVKFTPDDGRVSVAMREQDGQIVIAVHDTGIGISPDFLPYVFDRFRQAEGTVTRVHGGLGIGLSIVRHLVELHGGRVSVESKGDGRGATFTVSLPIAAPAGADAAASSAALQNRSR